LSEEPVFRMSRPRWTKSRSWDVLLAPPSESMVTGARPAGVGDETGTDAVRELALAERGAVADPVGRG